ncbi:hypothetical protein N9E91_03085 [Alphaproteobacteria bacterium]|nr:hypothetical protein [Alphaproteobacteria bacterium]
MFSRIRTPSILLMGGVGNQLFIISKYIDLSRSQNVILNARWFDDDRVRGGEGMQVQMNVNKSVFIYAIHRMLLKANICSYGGFTQGYFQHQYSNETLQELSLLIHQTIGSPGGFVPHDRCAVHLRLRIAPPSYDEIAEWVKASKQKKFMILYDSASRLDEIYEELLQCFPEDADVTCARETPLLDLVKLVTARACFFNDSTFSWWAWNLRRFSGLQNQLDMVPVMPSRTPAFDDV